jgi:hypothetical protein
MLVSRRLLETISANFKLLSTTHCRYSPKIEFRGPSLSTSEYNLMKSVDTHVFSTLCHNLIKCMGDRLLSNHGSGDNLQCMQ